MAQQNKVARMENMPICTHLSNQILSSQFSFGNAEPGKVNNMTEMINQAMAGKKEGLSLFNENYFNRIGQAAYKMSGT
jgi:hypothetical protein